jgi:serine/threonine-protein kinase
VDAPQIRGYGILSPLGEGAGSVIYKAVSHETGQAVAIKWVPRRSRRDDRYIRQVENEWAVCSLLEHPNIVAVHELVKVRDLLWLRGCALVMEFVGGVPLADHEGFPLSDLVACFIQMACALEHIHQRDYAHCDLKPQNILLRSDGVVKLVDFGIAASLGSRRKRVRGTVNFIAPEQMEPGVVDRRSDIFNLGATMYRLLTGYSLPTTFMAGPGTSPQPGQRLWAAITKINPEVPESLAELVLDCSRRRLHERPASAAEVAERLEAIQEQLAHSGQQDTAEKEPT